MKAAEAVGKQHRPHGSIRGDCVSIKLCSDTAWAVVLGGSTGKHITVGIKAGADSRFVIAGREVSPGDWVAPLYLKG